ncbi:uncharacterized protein DFL_003193 [Arthrobotrys flagrans]|uniref:Uncharacterized protein n=1 Tax=Arthrobotrys flagrans TaxID=97331 RepID=A0A437A1B6_ARTFL|nr:hypothetical protein DFL_003193 [Arthrobotrys flagrans]
MIKLGGLIESIEKPNVYRTKTLPPDEKSIRKGNSKPYKEFLAGTFGFGGGIFTEFLKVISGISAIAELVGSSAETMEIECRKLETKCFEPTPEYLRQALSNALKDGVTARYLRSRYFGTEKKLFMITGIKTAEGVTISTTSKRNNGFLNQVGIDTTMAGIPVGFGAKIEIVRGDLRMTTIKTEGPIILAYRVAEIIKKFRGDAKTKDYKRGALMGGRFARPDQVDEFELDTQGFDNDDFVDFGIEQEIPVTITPVTMCAEDVKS